MRLPPSPCTGLYDETMKNNLTAFDAVFFTLDMFDQNMNIDYGTDVDPTHMNCTVNIDEENRYLFAKSEFSTYMNWNIDTKTLFPNFIANEVRGHAVDDLEHLINPDETFILLLFIYKTDLFYYMNYTGNFNLPLFCDKIETAIGNFINMESYIGAKIYIAIAPVRKFLYYNIFLYLFTPPPLLLLFAL
jgi:hypothetical protein